MPETTACRSAVELEQLISQPLPADAAEELARHLEQCDRCAETVDGLLTRDTLAEAVRTQGGLPEAEPSTRVRELIAQLTKMGQIRAKVPVVFSCSHCGRRIKCKPELAGKKVKCPQCGKSIPVPLERQEHINTPAPVRGEERTLPPQEIPSREAGAEGKTIAPDMNHAEAPTIDPKSSPSGQTVDTPSENKHDNEEAWDFLAPAQAPDEIGRLGPYRILKVLGAGGMGVVFRAEDPQLERIVALKAMLPALAASPSAKKRFLREAKTAASIKHDHIVTIFQVGEDRGAPYLAMEFLHGEPLDARIKRSASGSLPLPDVLRIGEQVAEGLAAAHDEGLIHRDIKPANIWMEIKAQKSESRVQKTKSTGPAKSSDEQPTGGYRVKILDFGLARSTSDQAGLTQSGAIIGTPSYMAPEQASGKNVDHRCDLFSLGCVLYVMSTGQMPFKGEDTITVLMAIASTTPPPPRKLNPEVPQALSKLIMQLLAKKPEDRSGSAREVAEALRAMLATNDTAATAQPSGKRQASRPADKKKRLPLVLAAVAFGVLALLAAGIIFFLQTPNGTLRVEINDPEIEVAVKGTSIVLKKADGIKDITLTVGERFLKVSRGDFFFETSKLILRKGEITVVKVELLPGMVQVVHDGKVIGEKALATTASPGGKGPAPTFTNSIGMKFAWIPPGTFIMGSPKEEIGRGAPGADEIQHKVTLTKGFYMGVYAVTQEEWQAVMGNNPSTCKGDKNRPVETVSWDDCQEFIKKLREKDKKPYRLPTEAEWEYACRAGTTSPFHFGETITSDQANYNGTVTYGNGKKGVHRNATWPVGSFPANAWGLHDMHGNACQWCQDWYGEYPQKDVVDPQGPEKSGGRVLRGSSWSGTPLFCRSAHRAGFEPGYRGDGSGLRVCFCKDDEKEKEEAKTVLKPKDPPKIVTNSIGMKFAWVPPGNFMMGSPKEEKGREPNEIQHKVTLTKGFYMGVYTVTQEEWQAVMGNNPSGFKGEKKLPVEQVSWTDCQEFIKKLREKDKKPYRLPTEAEWEYACRAGATTPFHFGETISTDQANYNGQPYGNGKEGVKRDNTRPVGSFPANAWGLHDMHGNVNQWCQDGYGEYPQKDMVDPQGSENGERRVLRGGSWYNLPWHCRSACRSYEIPGGRNKLFGVRVCFYLD